MNDLVLDFERLISGISRDLQTKNCVNAHFHGADIKVSVLVEPTCMQSISPCARGNPTLSIQSVSQKMLMELNAMGRQYVGVVLNGLVGYLSGYIEGVARSNGEMKPIVIESVTSDISNGGDVLMFSITAAVDHRTIIGTVEVSETRTDVDTLRSLN